MLLRIMIKILKKLRSVDQFYNLFILCICRIQNCSFNPLAVIVWIKILDITTTANIQEHSKYKNNYSESGQCQNV